VNRELWSRRLLAAGVGIGVHVLLGVLAWSAESVPSALDAQAEPVKVQTFEQRVQLNRPPPPPPRVETPKPPEALPEPVKPPEERVRRLDRLEERTEAPPPPAARPPRPRTRRSKRTPRRSPPAPRTVVLANAMAGTSGVRVYQGDEDVLGSPEVPATEESTQNATGPASTGTPSGSGDSSGGPASVERRETPPRPIGDRAQGRYPDAAPRLGRTVTITLSIRVGTDGRVRSARVVARSPSAAGTAFDAEARRVAQATRFEPARLGQERIAKTIRYRVKFTPP